MNIVAHRDTNLMLPSDIPLLTPESIKSRIDGSKLVLVVEQSMIMTIWGCKISLLLMYNKLTFGLRQQLAVKIVGGYVVVNWIVMEILYFGVWCRPCPQYWAVPVANGKSSPTNNRFKANINRTMLSSNPPPNCQRRFQSQLGYNDALHPPPPPNNLATPTYQETNPLHPLLPRHLRHPVRRPQQILLFRPPLLPNVGILVYPRSIDGGLGSQYADVLAAPATHVQFEGV